MGEKEEKRVRETAKTGCRSTKFSGRQKVTMAKVEDLIRRKGDRMFSPASPSKKKGEGQG